MKLSLRFDLRLAPFSPLTREQLYKACLDQCAFIEEAGFDEVSLPEHHSAEDGYCPSNIVLGAAIAARTRRITIALKAILLPLHNPIRLAEDLAVLDLISNGRLRVLFGGGYRPVEYRLFGVDIRDRARLMADKVAVLRKAWSGETFDVDGSKIRVTPAPSQPGGPKIIFGGSTEWVGAAGG